MTKMNSYMKVSEMPSWMVNSIMGPLQGSVDQSVRVVDASKVLGKAEGEFSLALQSTITAEITLLDGGHATATDKPLYLASMVERNRAGLLVPVVRALLEPDEGSNRPCRFTLISGPNGPFPATMGIRAQNIKEILEHGPYSSIPKDSQEIRLQQQKLQERYEFYSQHATKSGEYWNWHTVSLPAASLRTIRALYNALDGWSYEVSGTTYPFYNPAPKVVEIPTTAPFASVIEAAAVSNEVVVG